MKIIDSYLFYRPSMLNDEVWQEDFIQPNKIIPV